MTYSVYCGMVLGGTVVWYQLLWCGTDYCGIVLTTVVWY